MLVLRTNPFAARLFSRLVTQLVPAALVTGVGILLLSNLAKTPDTSPVAAPVETAINAEAVFKITPREPEEAPAAKSAAPRITAAPKQTAVNTVSTVLPPRRPTSERQVASTPAPLPTVQIAAQPPAAATPTVEDSSVMGKLRNATATVQRIPQWTARSVAGWFSAEAPPRPPARVPAQNFQASM
jgi:type IV secretory pathway VirB10-like protein